MDRFDLVIFDCDGVLIDSEVISARMLVKELAGYGVQVDMAYVVRHFLGRSYPVVLSQIRSDFGIVLPEGFEEDYRARLLDAFARDLVAMPGIFDVLQGLRVPYCLATSSSPARLKRSLQIVRLGSFFDGRMATASEVSRGKPAPDLFLHVAARFGAQPARCLVIEDSLAGIRAGLAAGMTVWQFTGGSHFDGIDVPAAPDAMPHGRLESFADFFDLVPEMKSESGPDGTR